MKLKAILVAGALALAFTAAPEVDWIAPAFADTVAVTSTGPTPPVIASTPEAVTAAKEDTSVTIEWGNMLNYAVKTLTGVLVLVLGTALTYASTYVPGIAGMVLRTLVAKNGEKLVQNLVDYATNAVAGATKDKKMDIEVGSKVIAAGLERVINLQNEDKLLKWIVGQIGGIAGVGDKMFRKLDLVEGASKSTVLQPALDRYPIKR